MCPGVFEPKKPSVVWNRRGPVFLLLPMCLISLSLRKSYSIPHTHSVCVQGAGSLPAFSLHPWSRSRLHWGSEDIVGVAWQIEISKHFRLIKKKIWCIWDFFKLPSVLYSKVKMNHCNKGSCEILNSIKIDLTSGELSRLYSTKTNMVIISFSH